MKISIDEQLSLVEDLKQWIATARPSEILEYARSFPEEQRGSWGEIVAELIADAAKERERLLEHSFGPEVSKAIDVATQHTVIALCQYYNPKSVLSYYLKDVATSISGGEDMSAAATAFLSHWNHVLQFATAPHFLYLQTYLTSLVSAGASVDYTAVLNDIQSLDPIPADGEMSGVQRERVAGILLSLQIIPETAIETYLNDTKDALISLLADLSDVLAVLGNAQQTGAELNNTQALSAILWKLLCERFDTGFASREIAAKEAVQELEKITDYVAYCKKLLHPTLVGSGKSLPEIQAQKKRLPEGELALLTSALRLQLLALPSSVVYLLNSEEEDLETLISQIVASRDENTLQQLIAQRIQTRKPTEVSTITNLIQIIAEVF